MSASSSTRPRREGVDYSLAIKTNVVNIEKFSPIDNKKKKKKQGKNTDNTIEEILNKSSTRKTQPSVEIQMKDNPVIEEIIDGNKATEQEVNKSIMIDNFGSENLDDNQSWTQVSKGKKGKQKEVPKTIVNKTGDNEDNKSVTSYVSENNYQVGWRNTMNANKYKIWTLASKIPGKNIGEKIEKIKKIFSKEKSLISVTSEYSANNRMITAFFSNENAMQEARKLDLGDNETQPTHIHRAQVFKRNVEKEKQYGVKLWDIPVGIKYKEIKIELELKYGPIE